MDLEEFREEFPIAERFAYLDHAAVSPLPQRTVEAMAQAIRERQAGVLYLEEWKSRDRKVRALAACLINASPGEMALVQNTAQGINIAAHSLDLRPGQEVIFCDMEYPANVYPWLNLRRRGVEVKIIPHHGGGLDLGRLEEEISERTKVVAVSSVEFLTGFKNDLKGLGHLCRERGLYLVVDAIQSLGVIPLDVQECQIDILSCGAPKWLLGPAGVGIFYCREELIERLIPPYAGASSVVDAENYLNYDLTFLPHAGRFEVGTPNLVGVAGLCASLSLLMEVSIERIEERTHYLTDLLIVELKDMGLEISSPLEPEHRSAIVTFALEGAEKVHQALRERKVMTSFRKDAQGKGYIRVSPHGYNREEDITALTRNLRAILNLA